MKTLRILYHIARADFLERVRQYSFLVMLGLVLWIGYLSASGTIRMRIPPDHIGIVNSAWVGGTMTITVSLLLGWVGFYIVKGSVNRDYITGVGQIMATTPLNRPLYMLGKWLSNFAVLGITILILLFAGILMNLFSGVAGFSLTALAAPLVIIAIPSVAMIAAFAILFESVRWLRGGLGNIIYFFFFLFILILTTEMRIGSPDHTINPYIDYSGWQIVGDSVSRAAQAVYPDSAGGFTFSITPLESPQLFVWNGVEWTAGIILSRVIFLGAAAGIAMLSALLFDRFNPSIALPVRRRGARKPSAAPGMSEPAPLPAGVLTPLGGSFQRAPFLRVLAAELKLFLKGRSWWWYAVAAVLVVAQLTAQIETARTFLIIAWIWPILILSKMGCREIHFDTRQIVFSSPRPVENQLPAMWLSALIVLALLGSGALVRFIQAGDTFSMFGWMTGLLFIPSLALASGIVTGSSKVFEALYVLWMYLLTQQIAPVDFLGINPGSPLHFYALLAVLLVAVSVFARHRQLRTSY
jgi:hypothetical protein